MFVLHISRCEHGDFYKTTNRFHLKSCKILLKSLNNDLNYFP